MDSKTTKPQMPLEIVLPNGKFVQFKRPTLGTMLAAMNIANSGVEMQAVFLSLISTVDGERLSPAQWADMDAEDAWPAFVAANKIFKIINDKKDGVA